MLRSYFNTNSPSLFHSNNLPLWIKLCLHFYVIPVAQGIMFFHPSICPSHSRKPKILEIPGEDFTAFNKHLQF